MSVQHAALVFTDAESSRFVLLKVFGIWWQPDAVLHGRYEGQFSRQHNTQHFHHKYVQRHCCCLQHHVVTNILWYVYS